jgi:hypothetical protein
MTSTTDRARLVLHGAIVLFVGLMCGLPTVMEEGPDASRHWHTAHEALIMMGIWILTTASLLSVLVLDGREARALKWCMLALGYGFMLALIIQGVTGYPAFEPGTSPVRIVEFTASTIGIFGAVMGTLITMRGAKAAMDERVLDRD